MQKSAKRYIRVGVLTISDRLSQHNTNLVYENKSLPIMESYFTKENGFEIVHRNAVPDTKSIIQDQLLRLSESASAICDVIITTGGTGFAPRDVTPEATVEVLHRQAPQLSALMLHGYMDSKPMVALSRGVCGIRHRTLICNLPGSPKGVNECLTKLMPVLEHACHTMLDWNRHVTAVHGDWKPTAMHLPGGGGEEVVKTSTTVGHHHSHHHCHHQHQHHQIHSPLAQSSTTVSPSVAVANRHRKSPWPLIDVGEALQHVRREACGQDWRTALVQREVSSALLGMSLGEDICAPCHFPPFPTSLKDGYAIRSVDGSGVYQVLGTVTAGEVPTITRRSLQPFECWRITTGAVIPSFLAADAVAMVEFSELVEANAEGEEVQIRMQFPSHAEGEGKEKEKEKEKEKGKGKLSAGTDIRPTGSDWKQGTRLLRQGTVLDAAGLGLLAAIGMTSVKVYEPLTVGVLSTGNEIVNVNASLPSQQDPPLAAREAVNDSNRPMLLGLLRREPGVEVVDLGIAPDRKDAIKQVLQQAFRRCHLVISTGGASMGELDFIKTILEEYQATLHFGRVKMKPGKPTTFATLHPTSTSREERMEEGKKKRERKKCLFFGLPGNPVSAYCTYHLFALEAIRSWNRQSEPPLSLTPQTERPSGCPRIQVRWRGNDPIRYDAERAEYYRAIVYVNPLGGELVAQRPPGEPMSLGSSNIWNCVGSNALLELPCKEGQLEVGEMCMALMTGPIALE
jgi:gephyrin